MWGSISTVLPLSNHSFGSNPFTSAPIVVGKRDASKDSIGPMPTANEGQQTHPCIMQIMLVHHENIYIMSVPDFPSRSASQNSLFPPPWLPSAETTPMPVITTFFFADAEARGTDIRCADLARVVCDPPNVLVIEVEVGKAAPDAAVADPAI